MAKNVEIAADLARMKAWGGDETAGSLREYEKGPDLRYGDQLSGYDSAGNVQNIIGFGTDGYLNCYAGIPGRQPFQVGVYIFDPSTNEAERTVAAHVLPGPAIPDNAIIYQAWYEVLTTFESLDGADVDKATIALHVNAANDLVTATAIEAGGDIFDADATPIYACVPVGTAATMIKLTAARTPTATVAVDPLTAGKLVLYVVYMPGL